ncbi:transposase, IS605 OrfB family, central region [Corchorus olitorius]|uniref:Transposase, IS605 OrfB family, central region n=1 Tax=Corchorus olitorius TaxID=93759 RepID=A0A1R3KEA8_9ROSI|nr:transposase, IS605 OrfB family, central region [Corchorus olitorius]
MAAHLVDFPIESKSFRSKSQRSRASSNTFPRSNFAPDQMTLGRIGNFVAIPFNFKGRRRKRTIDIANKVEANEILKRLQDKVVATQRQESQQQILASINCGLITKMVATLPIVISTNLSTFEKQRCHTRRDAKKRGIQTFPRAFTK